MKTLLDAIIDRAHRVRAKLVIAEPLMRFHRLDENDNGHMEVMVEALERLAGETGAAVLVGHHSNKLAIVSGSGDAQQATRGASSLIDGVRWACYVLRPGEKDQGLWTPDTRRRYALVGISKTNYGPPPVKVTWRHGANGPLEYVGPAEAGTDAVESRKSQKKERHRRPADESALADEEVLDLDALPF